MGQDSESGKDRYSAFFFYDHDKTPVSGLLKPEDDFITTFQDDFFK